MQQSRSYISLDGRFMWNGQAWLALSPDGKHVWDGANWQPRSLYEPNWPAVPGYVPAYRAARHPVKWKYAIVSVVAGAQGVFGLVLGLSGPNGAFLVFGLVELVAFVLAAWYSRGWTRVDVDDLPGWEAAVVHAVYILGWLNFCIVGVLFGIRDAAEWHERSVRASVRR